MIPISPVIITYADNYNDSNAVPVTVLMVTLSTITICEVRSLLKPYK